MQYKFCKIFLSVIITATLFISNIYATIITNNLTTIDTLVLYNQDVVDRYNGEQETKIEHLITTTNNIFKDSGLNIRLNVVKMQQYYLDSNYTARTIIKKIQNDTNITHLRNSVGADEVIIYRPYREDGVCGIGYINQGNPDYAYAYVAINCASYHTAHEIGHNLGLYHSENSYPNSGYARGYGIENEFETIMAYKEEYNGKKIYKFSSPLLDCDGQPCGIDEGYEHEADAVKAINSNAPTVALFRNHIDNNDTNIVNKSQKEYELLKERYEKVTIKLNKLYDAYSRINSTYQSYLSKNKLDNYELYILKLYRDKFYLAYETYKNSTYLPIKQEFEALKNRLKL